MEQINVAAPAPLANMGEPIRRTESLAKVTGKVVYAADATEENLLQAYFLTSAIARGRILSIDTTPAESLVWCGKGLYPPQRPPQDCDTLHAEGRLRF
jgi:xanthine dehydrogenase YagR molybdenum-binding subunit